MLDHAQVAAFVREGLLRYPDARETVDFFQTSILDALTAAFQSKPSWRNFQPRLDSDGNLQSSKIIGAGDRYIQLYIEGTVPGRMRPSGKAWLSLGLFWKPTRRPNTPVVAACHSSTEKGAPVPLLDLPDRDKRIMLGPLYKRSERRLFLEAGPDFEPAETFALLLEAGDDALAEEPVERRGPGAQDSSSM